MNKYHNVKVDTPYGKFDSKHEYAVFNELWLFHRAGLVTRIDRQVKFELLPAQKGERSVCYVADFVVHFADGSKEVWDAKGIKTPLYILKRKLMLFIHGIKVIEK